MACHLQACGSCKVPNVNDPEQAMIAPAGSLALALIISSQTPLVLLDDELRVVAASASFYRDFAVVRPCPGRPPLAALGAGEWAMPQLAQLLRATAAGRPPIEAYEMDLVRPGQPTCRLVLSAHRLDYEGRDGEPPLVVLALADVTAARLVDKQKDDLLRERQILMQELQHRVANSLQIIASVLLQSARKVNSEETRNHLKDAHHRVMSVATLQKQLATTQEGDVGLRGYFGELCACISASMISDGSLLSLTANVDDSVVDARVSVSLGLIVTELVINALKHAFPDKGRAGTIRVAFRSAGSGWTLCVEDDGAGFPVDATDAKPGLGTGIVEALARQLDARVVIAEAHPGTSVTVSRA
jgi:two-component sensor histidine kinase